MGFPILWWHSRTSYLLMNSDNISAYPRIYNYTDIPHHGTSRECHSKSFTRLCCSGVRWCNSQGACEFWALPSFLTTFLLCFRIFPAVASSKNRKESATENEIRPAGRSNAIPERASSDIFGQPTIDATGELETKLTRASDSFEEPKSEILQRRR